MNTLPIILFLAFVLFFIILRFKRYIFSKLGGIVALRTGMHVLLLAMVVIGTWYSFHLEENSIAQKLVIKITFGAWLFWITPFCLKLFKHTWGTVTAIALSIACALSVFLFHWNEVIQEYCIELSVGIMILLFLEFFFKERNRMLKYKYKTELEFFFKQLEKQKEAALTAQKLQEEWEAQQHRQAAEDDEKYAIQDYFGIPRPLNIMSSDEDGEGMTMMGSPLKDMYTLPNDREE